MPHGRIFNLFRRFRAGDPTAAVANIRDLDLMKNFVEGLHGVGCRVWKDTENSLRSCRIIVDGSSDIAADETEEMAQYRRQASGAFPYGSTKWLWGVDVDGAVVTVGAGALRRAGSIYTCAADDITVTANSQWIGWQFDPATNTLTIIGPEDDMPEDGDGYMRGPLYNVTFADSRVTGLVVWQFGIVVSNLYG